MNLRDDDGGARGGWAPWLTLAALLAATAAALRWQGRLWLCACGGMRPWVGDAWSPDTSQHLFDPYSLTHVLHGFALCGLLALVAPRLAWRWRFLLAVAAEAAWEVLENTEYVINRYRETTAALGYNGDTVVNSLGDIVACAAGFLLARRLGLWRTALLFILTEAALILWIRDSLLLNILLLIYPSETLRAWQAGR
ncbi:MAG TPA: DUF2585 family protein [Pyrinomonadaceae bacterium]|jgi:hypothetical protein|nr:DUF2585 family protein [Pyrinomonadaceae bacterium]